MKSLTVPGTLDSLETIANYVIEVAKEAGLDTKDSYNLRLAIDEIATNIIIHGYQENNCEGDINISADLNEKNLTIFLQDGGPCYDPTQQPPEVDLDLPLEEREIGGLGIYLAMEGVDEFRYERINDKNHNIFVVNRRDS